MSNTRRPSTARKVTTSSEATRRKSLTSGVAFTIQGKDYEIRLGQVRNALVTQMRDEYGWTPLQLLNGIRTGSLPFDLDVLAALMWLSDRMHGRQVTAADIDISYDDLEDDTFTLKFLGDEDDEVGDDDPET